MKTLKLILKIAMPVILIGLIIFYTFSEITPVDDTRKLHIKCNDNSDSYEIFSGTEVSFAPKDTKCKLEIKVRNVDRTYLKLKSDVFMYRLDGNKKIDDDTLSKDLFVLPDDTLILYSQDKSTKFEFEYK